MQLFDLHALAGVGVRVADMVAVGVSDPVGVSVPLGEAVGEGVGAMVAEGLAVADEEASGDPPIVGKGVPSELLLDVVSVEVLNSHNTPPLSYTVSPLRI